MTRNDIPNALTMLRMILIPVIAFLFFMESTWGPLAAWINLGIYSVAVITDYLDGYLARKWKVISPFGTFLDPISDKILVACLLILLLGFGRLEGVWMIPVMLILTREFLIAGLREYLGPHDVKMPVTKLAKWKTAAQMLALGFLIIGPYAPIALLPGQILLWFAALITVVTGWGYMKAGLAHMRGSP